MKKFLVVAVMALGIAGIWGVATARAQVGCADNRGCAPGDVCINNVCKPAVADGQVCVNSQECLSGRCVSGICKSPGQVGEACTEDGECVTNNCFDGLCGQKAECNADGDCGAGRTCTQNKCVETFSTEPPAPPPSGDSGGLSQCQDEKGCPAGQVCVDHVCRVPVGTSDSGKPVVNRYCLKDDMCQPMDPVNGCPAGWAPKPKCPCPNSDSGAECIPLENPLAGNTVDIFGIFGRILRVALGLIGSLTLLMLVWGGFQWMMSGGSPERIKKGTDTMLWAAIGVVLVFASYFILSNFVDYLTGVQ
ncbi:MAG: hypothetical protein Q7K39_03230 [Candidatus Magasanikbacteria bacterium]|nr:hypothetical protein [Candidatus Magasanikbacteria bacterium]